MIDNYSREILMTDGDTQNDERGERMPVNGDTKFDGKLYVELGEAVDICVSAPGDAVEHPTHYNTGCIEVWDAIADWGLDFLLGNVVKYVARAGHKGDAIEDLKKARQYIDKAIEVRESR